MRRVSSPSEAGRVYLTDKNRYTIEEVLVSI